MPPGIPAGAPSLSGISATIASEAVAGCVAATLASNCGARRYELAGPQTLSYDDIVRAALGPRPLVHVPLPVVRAGLRAVERVSGPAAFATWEEAELLEEPMTTTRGTAGAEALGVRPRPMGAVLGSG